MDTETYGKLEYITSGTGISKTELGEIVDLMESFAEEHANSKAEEMEDKLKELIRLTFVASENGGSENFPFDSMNLDALEGMKRAFQYVRSHVLQSLSPSTPKQDE